MQTTTSEIIPFVFFVENKGEENFFKGDYLDYPLSQVVVNGEVWSFHTTTAYNNPTSVIRYKGSDFEHMVRQPDGKLRSSEQEVSCHIGCGMWFDDATGTLYALIHSEYDGNIMKRDKLWNLGAAWCRKKTRLATSKDMGLTWSDPKDVLTACLPEPGDWSKYAGSDFEMGPADFDLYTDIQGGYFYVTCWNGFVAKKEPMNKFGTYTEVSRCAISDKMAPGKWYKFRNGAWTEPGLGGKASRVSQFPIYGRTIYNSYLKKYLRVGINIRVIDERFKAFGLVDASVYILTCTDLAKQDWSLPAKLMDEPGNIRFSFSLSDPKGNDFTSCGKTFRIYNYWTKPPVRMFDVVLGEGTTPAITGSRYGAYCYESHPESGDATGSRNTQLAGSENVTMQYTGTGWKIEKQEHYFHGCAKSSNVAGDSVEFPFKGSTIYWRTVFAKDAGKVDVYIDQQFQETIDCFYSDPKQNMFQFGFIRTNLNASASHTIKIVVRSDRNQNAVGTNIRHIGFEYGVESIHQISLL